MNVRPALMLLLIPVACSDPADIARVGDDGRVIGTIEYYGDPVQVEIPTDATRGSEFTVTVVTYGGGCVSEGETETDIDGLNVVVTPYDYDVSGQLPPNGACTDELNLFEHETTLRFDRAGTATVVIRGQRKPSQEIFSVKRTIEVR